MINLIVTGSTISLWLLAKNTQTTNGQSETNIFSFLAKVRSGFGFSFLFSLRFLINKYEKLEYDKTNC